MIYGSVAVPHPGYTLIETPEMAVAWFRRYAELKLELRRDLNWLEPLRGHDLACWCDVDAEYCHVDVLLELVNKGEL